MQKVRRLYKFLFDSTAYKVTDSWLIFINVYNALFQTFPSRYFSLSLNDPYLALEDGSPVFGQVISHLTQRTKKRS